MPTTRTKFVCTTKEPGTKGAVTLEAVINGSEENKSFFEFTPSGLISLGILNEEAFKNFEVGQEYYVDFTPAVKTLVV